MEALPGGVWDVLSEIFSIAEGVKRKLEKLLDPAEERELEFIDQVAKSSSKNLLFGLPKDAVLVFGHTHRAFASDGVANSGSWVIDPKKQAHTYVEILEGDFRLKPFPQTKNRLEEVRFELRRATKAAKRKSVRKRAQGTRASRSRKPRRG